MTLHPLNPGYICIRSIKEHKKEAILQEESP